MISNEIGGNIWSNTDFFCDDLPTKPDRNIGTVLVTGASGYIGGRLVPELLARGYRVRMMVRGNSPECSDLLPELEVIEADALNLDQLQKALEGIDTAYYLIHSLYLGPKDFEVADIQAAANFRLAARRMGAKRIIYLGGLGDKRVSLSSHLRNRMEVADELIKGDVPVTIVRAAVIIGSGSASYEIIRNLVNKSPVILLPRWTKNRCQPISVRDVIKYLTGVLEVPETTGKNFDIGGSDVLTYEEMLRTQADVFNRKTVFIPSRFSFISLYAYWVSLLTPVPNAITQCLMKGLVNEVICLDDSVKQYLPFETLSYREAVIRAMSREQQDRVYTRWSDAYPPAHELAMKLSELKGDATFTTDYFLDTHKEPSRLFKSICQIGGNRGWFHNNWMWRLRGNLDRILMGVGSSRGRKSYTHLQKNDVIDFWRIEDIRTNQRLLLRAEMKIPGRAWLEFKISDKGELNRLSITAYYDTHKIWGYLYWYLFLPFHWLIFKRLIEAIEEKS